ncbi:MAG: hypothetical protein PHZ00_01995 [Candidatus Peribacteraceae bacterium]|nr:hypothetical protein [Candidatus Peribacteraceae bacterium]
MNTIRKHHRRPQEDTENQAAMPQALARLAAAWGATLILRPDNTPSNKPQR